MVHRATRRAPFCLLALLAACSPDRAGDGAGTRAGVPTEPAQASEGAILSLDGRREAELTREEIWAIGVERLHWHPEQPPADWTKEMMLERMRVDERFATYEDSLGYD